MAPPFLVPEPQADTIQPGVLVEVPKGLSSESWEGPAKKRKPRHTKGKGTDVGHMAFPQMHLFKPHHPAPLNVINCLKRLLD